MTELRVKPAKGSLRGIVPAPSDKSIAHRALLLGALGAGRSKLTGFSYGQDNVRTQMALGHLGVSIEDDGQGCLIIEGVGLAGFQAPGSDIDCGNSGTSMRLLCGLLAAQSFQTRLVGDESLSTRPMGRVAEPLRARGAIIEGRPHRGRANDITAPLVIGPLGEATRLRGIEYALRIASAQVKSALLLSGLFADGTTVVAEPLLSRDHTERMLRAVGAQLTTMGTTVQLVPPAHPRALSPFELELPGDLSAAAFPLVAAALVPDSQVGVRHTGLNPTRTGIIDILKLLGATVRVEPHDSALGEPVGTVMVAAQGLIAQPIGGELATRAIDEIPIACALAARARGQTEIGDVAELRVKESDRIGKMVSLLRAFGIDVEERPDGLLIDGNPDRPLRAATVSSSGDHRIAMTAAVLALVANGETVVRDVDCIATSFPRFVGTLRALGAEIEVQA